MSPDKNNFSFTSPSESFCLPNGALRIASFLRLIQETSIGGSAFLGDGVETLKAKNLYWVVMSYHFVVTRWPLANEKITIETYPGLTKAFIYPRHYVVYDEKGEIISEASRFERCSTIKATSRRFRRQTGWRSPQSIKRANCLGLPAKSWRA